MVLCIDLDTTALLFCGCDIQHIAHDWGRIIWFNSLGCLLQNPLFLSNYLGIKYIIVR